MILVAGVIEEDAKADHPGRSKLQAGRVGVGHVDEETLFRKSVEFGGVKVLQHVLSLVPPERHMKPDR